MSSGMSQLVARLGYLPSVEERRRFMLHISKFIEFLHKLSLSILIISDAQARIKGEEPKDKHCTYYFSHLILP